MVANANTDAGTAASEATGRTDMGMGHHVDADHQFDSNSVRSMDVDKDTGTDERYEVSSADARDIYLLNQKRTYDLHQTLDTEAILRGRRHEDEEREMRLRHAETEFNQRVENSRAEAEQRLRHYEDMHTMRYGIAGEMVEAIANKVADKVCSRMGK